MLAVERDQGVGDEWFAIVTGPGRFGSGPPGRRNAAHVANVGRNAEPAVRAGSGAAGVAGLPIGAFAAVMGLAGTSVAWQQALPGPGAPPIGTTLAWLALVAFAVLLAAYLGKAVRHPGRVAAEWQDVGTRVLVPTTTLAAMLVAASLIAMAPTVAAWLWWAGATGQLLLTVAVVRTWSVGTAVRPEQIHPGWFLPAVANLIGPLAGVRLGAVELSWLQFSIGIVYWLPTFALVLGRLVLSGPLPPRLTPLLTILVAPPALAALDWQRLGGSPSDAVSRVLLGVAVFHGAVLASQFRLLRRAPFAVTSWAYTFPLAALACALFAAGARSAPVYRLLGDGVLILDTLILVGLTLHTVLDGLRRRR